jgi:hypothetical protein
MVPSHTVGRPEPLVGQKNRDTREEAETNALENCDATNCEVRVFTGGNLLNQKAVFEESAKKLDY